MTLDKKIAVEVEDGCVKITLLGPYTDYFTHLTPYEVEELRVELIHKNVEADSQGG